MRVMIDCNVDECARLVALLVDTYGKEVAFNGISVGIEDRTEYFSELLSEIRGVHVFPGSEPIGDEQT